MLYAIWEKDRSVLAVGDDELDAGEVVSRRKLPRDDVEMNMRKNILNNIFSWSRLCSSH